MPFVCLLNSVQVEFQDVTCNKENLDPHSRTMTQEIFVSLFLVFGTGLHYAAQASLELMILSPLPPECWIIAGYHRARLGS
jgi:hypothetical protein